MLCPDLLHDPFADAAKPEGDARSEKVTAMRLAEAMDWMRLIMEDANGRTASFLGNTRQER